MPSYGAPERLAATNRGGYGCLRRTLATARALPWYAFRRRRNLLASAEQICREEVARNEEFARPSDGQRLSERIEAERRLR